MGIAIMALEVAKDVVNVVLGGVGNLVEGGGEICRRRTSAHWSMGMPEGPRAASTSSLQGQNVISSVEEKLFMGVMFCGDCCAVGSNISPTVFVMNEDYLMLTCIVR